MFNKAKDKMVGTAVRRLLESKLNRYGEIQNFSINTSDRNMSLTFLPTGEESPLSVNIDEYDIVKKDDGGVVISLEKVSADRTWANNLLEDHVQGMQYPLDGAAAKMVDMLL